MEDVGKLEKLRLCGRLETLSTSRHHLGYYNNVSLTATYSSTAPTSRPLKDVVYAALAEVIAKHSLLSAIVLNEDKSYPEVYYARLPSVDLRTCVEFKERRVPLVADAERDVDLDVLLAEQHSRGFKGDLGTKPFWRLAILTSSTDQSSFTAAWIFHHAHADGTSAFLFHETFVAALNNVTPSTKVDSIVPSPSTPLPLSFEELHPMGSSWPFFLKTVAGAFVPSVFNPRPDKLWTGYDISREISPTLNYHTMFLAPDTVSLLAKISRNEKVSVTATLQCLLAASLFANLPEDECESLKISGPISMRKFITIPDDQMTNSVGVYNFIHERGASKSTASAAPAALAYFSWDQARAVKAAIAEEVAKEGYNNTVAFLKYVRDIHAWFTDNLGKPRPLTAEISNVGVYKDKSHNEDDKAWKIGRMTFSQCASPVAGPFALNVVTGGDGSASLNFSWRMGGADEEVLAAVRQGFKQALMDLVSGYEV